MISLEKLATAPVLSLVGAVAAAVTAATGLSTSLGLTAFWTDTVVGLVFLALSGYWAILAVQASKPGAVIGFTPPDHTASASRFALRKVLPNALVAVLLLFISAWFLYTPAAQPFAPRWKLCGSISGGCSPSFCVVPLDSKLRPIDSECVAPLDVSGYIELTRRDGTDYRPSWIRIECQNKEALTRRTPDAFFVPACNGRMTLQ